MGVRNESAIIEQSLRALALYTNAIVVLDDASEDDTLEKIYALQEECKIERVITKKEWHRDEPGDRNALLKAGRAIGGTHFVVLDADEMFTATSKKYNHLRNLILKMHKGDSLHLNWMHLWGNFRNYRYQDLQKKAVIFRDDGRCLYRSNFIHTPRVPQNLEGGASLFIDNDDIAIMHFEAVSLDNLKIKYAWYKCLQKVRNPAVPAKELNDFYRGLLDKTNIKLHKVKFEWLDYSFFLVRPFTAERITECNQIKKWFHQYGADYFADLDLFSVVLPDCTYHENEPQEYTDWKKRHRVQEGAPRAVTPRQLVCADRYDLLAKYIYARLHELGACTTWGCEVYDAHIRVWNNYYEAYPRKNGIQAFYDSFHETISSIKKNGFDYTRSRVPVKAGTKMILNGAHRIGAALVYHPDTPLLCPVINGMHGAPFRPTADYFKNKQNIVKGGLATKYLDAMTLSYVHLKTNTFTVCLFPGACTHDNKVESILKEYATIVYTKDLTLKHHGARNFIDMLYDGESWTQNPTFLERKVDACFDKSKSEWPLRVYIIETDDAQCLVECKQKIRDLFDRGKSAVHINDTHEETLRIAQSVLNAHSVHFLNSAQPKALHHFDHYFAQYKKWLTAADVDQDCFCVDSSAVLAAYGLRDCKDLDFLHYGYDKQLPHIAGVDSHNSYAHHYPIHKDEIIFHPDYHFYYKGVKFASLDMVRLMKLTRNELEDQRDVQLIKNVMERE